MSERALQVVDPNDAPALDYDTLHKLVVEGDLGKLNGEQQVNYYRTMCLATGLDYRTRPFAFIRLNGKLVLYALREATEQLRRRNRVSVAVNSHEVIGDVYVVTARAMMPDGRTDESTGAVAISGLKGEALANAYMKAETKAKRRVTLSICGLGMLDESEVIDVPGAQTVDVQESPQTPENTPPRQIASGRRTLTLDEAKRLKYTALQNGYTPTDINDWLKHHDFTGLGQLTEPDADLLRRHSINGVRPWIPQPAPETVDPELVDVPDLDGDWDVELKDGRDAE